MKKLYLLALGIYAAPQTLNKKDSLKQDLCKFIETPSFGRFLCLTGFSMCALFIAREYLNVSQMQSLSGTQISAIAIACGVGANMIRANIVMHEKNAIDKDAINSAMKKLLAIRTDDPDVRSKLKRSRITTSDLISEYLQSQNQDDIEKRLCDIYITQDISELTKSYSKMFNVSADLLSSDDHKSAFLACIIYGLFKYNCYDTRRGYFNRLKNRLETMLMNLFGNDKDTIIRYINNIKNMIQNYAHIKSINDVNDLIKDNINNVVLPN